MIDDDQVPLFKAAKHILESWGIGPIRPPVSSSSPPVFDVGDAVVAEVRFSSKSINGSLSGLVSKSQFEKIVASMLGPNEKVDVSLINDAVGELINSITGTYLTEAFGSKIAFKLEAPRNINPADWKLPSGGRAVPGLTETNISLMHDGRVIVLAAEFLRPMLA